MILYQQLQQAIAEECVNVAFINPIKLKKEKAGAVIVEQKISA